MTLVLQPGQPQAQRYPLAEYQQVPAGGASRLCVPDRRAVGRAPCPATRGSIYDLQVQQPTPLINRCPKGALAVYHDQGYPGCVLASRHHG